MGNVIDYLAQYGDQAFTERAFCDVDVLILAQLSYFDFGSAVPTIAQHKKSVTLEEIDRTADLSAVFADKWYGENNRKLWNALLAGRRFRTMRCNYYREPALHAGFRPGRRIGSQQRKNGSCLSKRCFR